MPRYFAVKINDDGDIIPERGLWIRAVPEFTHKLRPTTTINDAARTFRDQGYLLLEEIEPAPVHAHTMRPEEV